MIRPVALALTAAAALAACGPTPSSTATSQGGIPFGPYYMVGIGKDATPQRNSTLVISGSQLTGTGPCNSFTATNSAEWPQMAVTNFVSTRMTCRDQALENQYFGALAGATQAEFNGGVLVIKGPSWIQFEAGTVQN